MSLVFKKIITKEKKASKPLITKRGNYEGERWRTLVELSHGTQIRIATKATHMTC